MDQDADGGLGATEDARDLGRRHLVDEPQDERPTPVPGQAAHGVPGGPGLGVANGAALDVEGIGEDGRGRVVELGGGMAACPPALVRDDVTGDLDAPSPSAGRARASKRWRLASAPRNVRAVASSAA
jgi:hypothetical protein